MTTPLDITDALPVAWTALAPLRGAITTRTEFCLAASEDLADFTVVDPESGKVPLYVKQNGTSYEYDSLDTTTVASAVCLVSGDTVGLRYKTGGITAPWSVLTVGTTAQPVSPAPAVGDTYLVPTAATGTDWAGKDGLVAIYSRAGWQFADVPIGRGLYAEDTNIRWFRKADGSWASGFGAVNVGAGGINITNMLGAKASFVVKVENQTTETPPASPVAFVAYVVGAVPTGAWSAYSPGDVAMCLSDGTWTRVVPATGDQVFDKNLNTPVEWNGTDWLSARGAIVNSKYQKTNASAGTTEGSGSYTYSAGTAPTTHVRCRDGAALNYTAKRAGARLRFKYRAELTVSFDAAAFHRLTAAVIRDTETTAIGWTGFTITAPTTGANTLGMTSPLEINITAVDDQPHDYYIAFYQATSNRLVGSMLGREIEVEEFA